MLEKKSVFWSAVYVFILALISSIIFYSLFGKLYIYIFNPVMTGGLGGWSSLDALGAMQNTIFAYLFFLPLFTMLFVKRKQWLVWLILIFIPFTMVLVGGSKHLLWFFIFTIAGGIIGWLINAVIGKYKR